MVKIAEGTYVGAQRAADHFDPVLV